MMAMAPQRQSTRLSDPSWIVIDAYKSEGLQGPFFFGGLDVWMIGWLAEHHEPSALFGRRKAV